MVYVDEIVDWGEAARKRGLRWTKWCHLIADNSQELSEIAQKLNLKREWIQNPDTCDEHYDLIPSKRTLAIKYGAKSISCEELGELMTKKCWEIK